MKDELTEFDLHAYLDGQLDPEREAQVLASLAGNPSIRERLRAYAEQKISVQTALTTLPGSTTDPRTRKLELRLARRLGRRTWVRPLDGFRHAAAVALLIGAGWVGHIYYENGLYPTPAYVAEAAGAHRVFADDRLRPVELPASQVDEMVTWLSDRLGKPIAVPVLDPLGIHLVGARLLGTREGPLAHLVYEDDHGHRMTLSMSPKAEEAGIPGSEPILIEVDGVRVGYWSDGSLGYVVAADTSDAQLQVIALEIGKPRPAQMTRF